MSNLISSPTFKVPFLLGNIPCKNVPMRTMEPALSVARCLNAWCELLGESLSGRCPPFRVGLLPDPQGKGTDSSWSI